MNDGYQYCLWKSPCCEKKDFFAPSSWSKIKVCNLSFSTCRERERVLGIPKFNQWGVCCWGVKFMVVYDFHLFRSNINQQSKKCIIFV